MKPWQTAITRIKPSKPMKIIESQLSGRLLDYGCGRGFDALHYKMEKYDPHWHPIIPEGTFDTITCNYVLNVIEDNLERLSVLNKIQSLLSDNGTAFVSVRRDLKENTASQFLVELALPVVYKDSSVCIYKLTKENV